MHFCLTRKMTFPYVKTNISSDVSKVYNIITSVNGVYFRKYMMLLCTWI